MRYQPGECNIGQAERRRRYVGGALGFAGAIAVFAIVLALEWPRWTVLFVALPLWGGFVGVLQGKEGFCVGYAMEGIYNVSEEVGDTHEIEDAEAHQRDKRRATQMVLEAGGIAVVLTVVCYLLVGLVG